MEVDHHIFHFRIVDGALGIGTPGLLGVGEIVEQADDIDRRQIGKFQALRITDPATENEMKSAHEPAPSIAASALSFLALATRAMSRQSRDDIRNTP